MTMKLENYLLKIASPDIGGKKNEHIHLHGVNSIFKETYLEIKPKIKRGEFTKLICSEIGSPKGTVSCWLIGHNPIPILKFYKILKLWKKICKKNEHEFNKKWDEVFEKVNGFSAWNSPKVTLPKELNEGIGYLCGFIIGDGHIKDEFRLKKVKGNAEYSISMYTNSLVFSNILTSLVSENFNAICNTHLVKDRKGSWYVTRFTSKPVYRFFTQCLSVPAGDRRGNAQVPQKITQSPVEIKKSFISGFFDAEVGAGITTKGPWFEIGQLCYSESSNILIWIKGVLEELSISLNGPSLMSKKNTWRLRTSSKKTISKFYRILSSRHPKKIQMYEKIERFCYGSDNRS